MLGILISEEPLWKLILSCLIMFGFGMLTMWCLMKNKNKHT